MSAVQQKSASRTLGEHLQRSAEIARTVTGAKSAFVVHADSKVVYIAGDALKFDPHAIRECSCDESQLMQGVEIAGHPALDPEGTLARAGIRMLASLPLVVNGSSIGSVGILREDVNPLDDRERYLLQLIARDVGEHYVLAERLMALESNGSAAETTKLVGSVIDGFADYPAALLDSEGKIKVWSSAAEAELGFEEEEVVGQRYTALVAEGQNHWLETAEAEGQAHSRARCRRKDGSSFPAFIELRSLRDDAGELHGFIFLALRD